MAEPDSAQPNQIREFLGGRGGSKLANLIQRANQVRVRGAIGAVASFSGGRGGSKIANLIQSELGSGQGAIGAMAE
jgi:hypothetical protein